MKLSSTFAPTVRELYTTPMLHGLPRDSAVLTSDDWRRMGVMLRTHDLYTVWQLDRDTARLEAGGYTRFVQDGMQRLRQTHFANIAAKITEAGYAGWPGAVWG